MILSPGLGFHQPPHFFVLPTSTRTTSTLRIRRMCTFINYLFTTTHLYDMSFSLCCIHPFSPSHLCTCFGPRKCFGILFSLVGLFGLGRSDFFTDLSCIVSFFFAGCPSFLSTPFYECNGTQSKENLFRSLSETLSTSVLSDLPDPRTWSVGARVQKRRPLRDG